MDSSELLSRRRFLQTALCSGLIYGNGMLPRASSAAPAPLTRRILVNLYFGGGPDFRHLIVPEPQSSPDTFGYQYWSNRWRAHRLSANNFNRWQNRWQDDYYPITVGGSGWDPGLHVSVTDVGAGETNDGVTFGIWREAGWLIDMFRAGHVALVFNAVGGTNRAHDLSTLMLRQGNLLSGLNDADRSGWGGRLARSAGGNSISLVSSPNPFSFGPVGDAPNYDPDAIDNRDLISVNDSRNMGLFDPVIDGYEYNDFDNKMARAAKSYYEGLRNEQIHQAYEKFMDHESKVREFGELIRERLDTVPEPDLIRALRTDVDGINPDPNNAGTVGRRGLRSTRFGRQIRNLYDVIAANDHLMPSTLSMGYGGWDSHNNQRRVPGILSSDPDNPFESRGIESGLRDIFGGQFGASPSDSAALHGGFSALWENLSLADRSNIVITMAGEFGRQIRDNGDAGTDHGKGNLMLVISEQCNGGIYGEMFPTSELPKYDLPTNRTPDITPRTEIDPLFAAVCEWVAAGSGQSVFPRTAPGYSGTAPIIELSGMFDDLMMS